MKRIIFVIAATCILNFSFAQYDIDSLHVSEEYSSIYARNEYKQFGLGIGFGLNYGGIGLNLTYAPIKYVSFTVHGGFNLVDFNAGIGANVYLNPRTKMYRPNLKVMYGYNAVIKIYGLDEYDKTYYGLTIGFGNELRFGSSKKHGLDVDLLVPFRSQEAYDDAKRVKNDPRVETFTDFIPIAISFGYHVDF